MRAVRASSWLALAMVLGLLIYLWVARPVDLQLLWATLKRLPWTLWPSLVGLSVLHFGCRFLRWRGFLLAVGAQVPVVRSLTIYMAGFVPGFAVGKAGELVRGVYLRPYGLRYTASAAAVLADRLLDVVSVGVLACLALGLLTERRAWAWSAMAFCLLVLMIVRARWVAFLLVRWTGGRWALHVQDGWTDVRRLLSGRRLAWGLGWSLLAWVAQGLCLWVSLRAVGAPVDAGHAVGVYSVGILAGAVSFIPGGFGASEAAMVWLLGKLGIDTTIALAVALVARGVPQWLGLACAALAMLRLGTQPSLPVAPSGITPLAPRAMDTR